MKELIRLLSACRPSAAALIKGSEQYPDLKGKMLFCGIPGGTLVAAELTGLPDDAPFLGMHLHNGKACTGNADDEFADAGTHLALDFPNHPMHTGDFPVLLNNGGYALSVFVTDRFSPVQIIGYPVIIHSMPDDYRTQPSGDSGKKIGCGIVTAVHRFND